MVDFYNFGNALINTGLFDLEYIGPKFMWKEQKTSTDYVRPRNRGLITPNFSRFFLLALFITLLLDNLITLHLLFVYPLYITFMIIEKLGPIILSLTRSKTRIALISLIKEEEYWKTSSRADWLMERDRSTVYFHHKTS